MKTENAENVRDDDCFCDDDDVISVVAALVKDEDGDGADW